METIKEKKSELERVSDYMDFMVYRVHTKDNICLECELRHERETVNLPFKWEWIVNRVVSESRWNMCGEKKMLYLTDKSDLEYCIMQMNRYIKDNFKTSLDNQTTKELFDGKIFKKDSTTNDAT